MPACPQWNVLTKWSSRAITNYGDCYKSVVVLAQKSQLSWYWQYQLDYYNSVLVSVPQSTDEPIQRVQSATTMVIFHPWLTGTCDALSLFSCTGYQFASE